MATSARVTASLLALLGVAATLLLWRPWSAPLPVEQTDAEVTLPQPTDAPTSRAVTVPSRTPAARAADAADDAPEPTDGEITIRGRVTTYDDEPIAGAEVRCSDSTATTDGAGGYVLRLATHRSPHLHVRATKPGYSEGFGNARLAVGDETTIDLRMGRSYRLRVRLVDRDTRAPVRGLFRTLDELVAAPDGELSIATGVGEPLEQCFGADGYCDTGWRWDRVAPRDTVIEIPLLRAAEIRGVVHDEAGEPVAGAEVRLSGPGAYDEVAAPDFGGPGHVRFQRGSADDDEAVTDHDGQFVFSHLPETGERAWIEADQVGFAASCTPDLPTCTPGQQLRVDLTLTRGHPVHGLLFENGAPAAGSKVNWRPVGEPHWRHGAVADERGAFTLTELPGGTIELCALAMSSEWLPVAVRTIEVPRQPATPIRLDWSMAFTTVAGTVVDPSGAPMPDVIVRVMDEHDSRRRMAAVSDAEGRFRVQVPAANSLLAIASRSGRSTSLRSVRPGAQDLQIVMPDFAQVDLVFVDEAGQPIPDEEIWLDAHWTDAERSRRTAQSSHLDHNGACTFSLPIVPALTARVATRDPRFAPTVLTDLALRVGSRPTRRVVLERRPCHQVLLRVAEDAALPDTVWRSHTLLPLRADERASVRGPLPPHAATDEGLHWIGGVSLAIDRGELMHRFVSLHEPAQVTLPAGTYTLCVFPDDIVFEPNTIAVPGDTDVTLRWRRR